MTRRAFIGGLTAAAGGAFAAPPPARLRIPTRMFWSWDHSTNWCENAYGAQNFGVGNAYTKYRWYFEEDYRRVVDWCAAHDMQAVGIVGLLRDRHYGVEGARRLCGYANKKGVRIYIIGGLYAYGGAYYEGDHKYSLDRFLEANPDCMARNRKGEPRYARFINHGGTKVQPDGCPSSKKLRDFVLESYDWLFKAIPELGGIQMEAGDNGTCQCAVCKERRGKQAANEAMSLEDMAGIYPAMTDVVRSRNKDALIICETYHHFLDKSCSIFYADPPGKDARALFNMPRDIFWQWRGDEFLDVEGDWKEGAALPPEMRKFHHVMRSHAGTQWWGGRNAFDVDKIRRQCRLSALSGLDGVSMFGEVSPCQANAEFNYLALQYFADSPLAPMDDFVKDVMAPRLGGAERAARWVEFARLDHQPERIPAATAVIAKLAADATDGEVRRRWLNLGARLESFHWEWQHNGHRLPIYSHHPEPLRDRVSTPCAVHEG